MYYEEKKKNKEKLITYCMMVVIITLLLVLVLRTEVSNTSINTSYSAEKINVDDTKIDSEEKLQEKPDTTKVIEKSVKSIVGISKLKQTGSSIFVNNAEKKLGLGSG